MSALGALRCLTTAGLGVPGDVSVVGFDDIVMAQYFQPPLTTVRQPKRQMGNLAMETLLKLMSGSRTAEHIRVPGELIVRESTAPLRKRREG